jgi:hypothetical protein
MKKLEAGKMENQTNPTPDTNTKENNEQLLRIKTGYDQHTSPNSIVFPEYHNATNPKIVNVLIQMKKDNKSDYTHKLHQKRQEKKVNS